MMNGKDEFDARDQDATAFFMDEALLALIEYRVRASELHRWRLYAHVAATALLVMAAAYYGVQWIASQAPAAPRRALAVVDIIGEIGRTGPASASAVVPLILAACTDKGYQGLVLNIDSGGGVVSEADRIAAALSLCRGEDGKAVHAVITGTGASAAYLIAAHADRITANRFALVGSVGAAVHLHAPAGGQVHGAQSVTSGELKLMLATPQTPAQREATEALFTAAAGEFERSLRERRPRITEWELVMTGQTFDARRAQELGLIDAIATLDFVIDRQFPSLTPRRVVLQ